MKKKKFKNLVNPNQRSFHYKDYYESNKLIKNLGNSRLSEDRIYLLFFLFITLYLIFNIKIFTTSLQKPKLTIIIFLNQSLYQLEEILLIGME